MKMNLFMAYLYFIFIQTVVFLSTMTAMLIDVCKFKKVESKATYQSLKNNKQSNTIK